MHTLGQLKVFAYNREEQADFTDTERNVFLGLRYCYDCFRAGYDLEECEEIMKPYIEYYEKAQKAQKEGE